MSKEPMILVVGETLSSFDEEMKGIIKTFVH